MNRDFTPKNLNYRGHSPNCVCESCSRKRIRETASAIDAWMQFEYKRKEERTRRRETRFKRKMERYSKTNGDS
jgi:hypothetical protein